jgi:hypothetical protein
LLKEPHRRSVEPYSANTNKEVYDRSKIMTTIYQIEISVVFALAAVSKLKELDC